MKNPLKKDTSEFILFILLGDWIYCPSCKHAIKNDDVWDWHVRGCGYEFRDVTCPFPGCDYNSHTVALW